MRKRLLAMLVCLAMLCSLLPAVAAAADQRFSDMPAESHWSYKALAAAVDNGLLQGSGGRLTPENKLTRAQMAAVINRAFGAQDTEDISIYTDVPGTAWYVSDIAKAVRMGTFHGNGTKMRPEDPISRQEAFAVLARAFKLPQGDASALDRFTDKATVSAWAVPELAAMAENGYVNGSNGKLNPLNSITRAEFAQVMYNMIRRYYKTAGTYSDPLTGNRMINAPGVTLRGVTVEGDLIVGEGAANGDVWIDNVKITGRLVIRGGGENSVHIINGSEVGSILIGKTGDGGVRLRTEEGCRVQTVVIDDGRDEIILEGRYNQVAIDTDAPVILRDAEITGLTVKAEGAGVTASGSTTITAASLTDAAKDAALSVGKDAALDSVVSDAPGAVISGAGTVRSAEVSGDNTRFDTDGTSLHVRGANGVTQNGSAVADGATVVTGSGETPPPHVHAWDGGTLTKAPSCTEAGETTFRCACGESYTEAIPALGHDWDQGTVTREPTAEADGEMTFICIRCGAKKTEPISFRPFAVVVNRDTPEEDTLFFSTLDEAMAEAAKNPYHNEPGEDPWTEYEAIQVRSAAAIDDLNLPAGYRLFVGAELTLTGTLTLGASDYPECPGMGAAAIFIPMFDETAVTLNDLKLYDGANPEDGTFSRVGDGEERLDVISLCGGRDEDGDLYEKPMLCFTGFYGQDHRFELRQDLDLTDCFSTIHFDDSELYVRANLTLDTGSLRGGDIVLDGGAGAVSADGQITCGYADGCAVQLGQEASLRIGTDGATLTGDAGIHRGFDMAGLSFQSPGEKATVSVDSGVYLNLTGENRVGENVTLVNNGGLDLSCPLHVEGSLDNRGEIRLEAYEAETEGYWYIGSLELDHASLRNSGTLELVGSEDRPRSQLNAYASSVLNDGGLIRSYGDLNICGSSLVNQGTIENRVNMNVDPGTEQWVRYGEGAEPVLENEQLSCSLLNFGTLYNDGYLGVNGGSVTNSGTIINRKNLNVCAKPHIKEVYTLVSVDGEPETREDWDGFRSWDEGAREEGRTAYWRAVACEKVYVDLTPASFTNSGNLINRDWMNFESVKLTNTDKGVVQNDQGMELRAGDLTRALYWEGEVAGVPEDKDMGAPEFLNAGKLANGSLTGVGSEDGGSNAWFWMEDGKLTNRGTVTNNGNLNLDFVDYDQGADARFETYNAGGTHITAGSLTVPHDAFFRNEGYMQINDLYGGDNEKCDLTGFADFFTTWNQDGNDSNWCRFTALVLDEDGYAAAVAAQRTKPDNMKYNRMDFCADLTFTRDTTLEDFGEYWVDYKNVTAWQVYDEARGWIDCPEGTEGAEPYDARVGAELTVGEGATLTVAAGNWLHVDGEWNEDDIRPTKLTVKGTLVIEPERPGPEGREWEGVTCGNVEIWSFGRFENLGTVENQGRFEIRYYDLGHWSNGRYIHEGRLGRDPACVTVNPPANTVYTAEVRSNAALDNAISSASPVFTRICLREDCTLTLTKDVTLSVPITDIEPGSGLIVGAGCTLTLPEGADLYNSGDVSVYGDLDLAGKLDNNQHLEIGAVTGNRTATVRVSGLLQNWNDLTVYPMGKIDLMTNGRVSSRSPISLETLLVEADPDADYTLSIFEEEDGLSFQVDTSGGGEVRLTGALPARFSTLHLMSSAVDIIGLDVPADTRIVLDDCWGYARVRTGSHSVLIDDGWNPEGCHGFEIEANAGAVIRVRNAQMFFADGYESTNVRVICGDRSYWLAPHIFGVLNENDSPGVYVSTDDPDVEYELRLNGQRLQFEKELIREDGKTHLFCREGSAWFTAGRNNDPGLELTVRLPGGPTVIFENVPVKPEWDEVFPD